MGLTEIREQIDALDDDIVKLLSQRSALVAEAGKLKKDEQGVRDPKRAEQVIEKVRIRASDAGLDPAIAEEIYRTIIGCFIRKEMEEFTERAPQSPIAAKEVVMRKAVEQDRDAITSIFNLYVEHSFAAYPEQPADGTFFDFMKQIIYGDAFYVIENEDRVVGFGFLKRHHAQPTFDRVAEVGYFLQPVFTRKGLGGLLLDGLEQEARMLGIDTLLAHISSRNQPSIAFHEKQGFRECGLFQRVSRKFGRDVDIIWMQKFI